MTEKRQTNNPYARGAAVEVTFPDGSQFRMPPFHDRLSNADIKAIPSSACTLRVLCDSGSLFAVVTSEAGQDHFRSAGYCAPRLDFDESIPPVTLPCVCGGTHAVDLKRALALAAERGGLHPRRRVVPVDSVTPTA